MKKIFCFIMVSMLALGITGCGNKTESEKLPKNKVIQTEAKEENKVLGAGEEFIFKKDGKDYYSIKINEVKTANDFEYKENFPESNRKQIVEVNYTYKNISKDDESKLEIHGAALKVMDSTGAIAESSDMFPKQQPQEIPVGANCTVQAYYGLTNVSNKIKISFTSEVLKKTVKFEMPVK